jgi:riboflavin synthase
MFTGIIEEKGTVKNIHHVSKRAVQLTIECAKVTTDVQIGDSIAINGICLTVTASTSNTIQVDVMPETIKATSLDTLTTNSHVNLERAIASNGRFGGHFVTGHVDSTGTIIQKREVENAIYYEIEIPEDLCPFLLMKGSIAVDGISLTIFGVREKNFTISLIPHTVAETTLGEKRKGDIVNIECDMLAKHVQNMLYKTNNQ